MLTVTQMRLYEQLGQRRGVSFEEMTERAGTGCFDWLKKRNRHTGRYVIFCGSGGNGGDGLVLARLVAQAGGQVSLVQTAPPVTKPAIAMAEKLKGLPITFLPPDPENPALQEALRTADEIVDGVYGVGFHGTLPTAVQALFRLAADSPGQKLALDLPSGMDATTGEGTEGLLPASVTFCFGDKKPGHKTGKHLCGKQVVISLDLPRECMKYAKLKPVRLTARQVRALLPRRRPDSHKGDYGKLLNLSGSAGMGGAAMMSTLAAMRMGAGITYLATPATAANRAAPHLMEAMTLSLSETGEGTVSAAALPTLTDLADKGITCTLIGCGLRQHPETARVVSKLIETLSCPVVLDADGLNNIKENPDLLQKAKETPILTPHVGEMARLMGCTPAQVLADPKGSAVGLAVRLGAVVVLKGHRTLIALPDGRLYQNRTGNPGLAKGGSGDVLAGMIAGLRAQGLSAHAAAVCGVWLHGSCADRLCRKRSEYTLLARDIIEEIPFTVKRLGR